MTSTAQSRLPEIRKKSLNIEKRRRELYKITIENQRILQRLQDRKPVYNVTRWDKQDQLRQKNLVNICEYPYQLRPGGVNSKVTQSTKAIAGYRNHQFLNDEQ